MVVTAGPAGNATQAPAGLTDSTGQVAAGAVGDMKWQLSVVPPGPKNPVHSDSCYTVAVSLGGSDMQGACNDIPGALGHGLGFGKPAAFTGLSDDGEGAGQQRHAPADADPAARALRPLDRRLAERHRAQRPVQFFSQVIHRRPPSTMSAPRSSPGAVAFLRRVASARDAWLLTVPTEQLSAAAVSASDRSSQ